MVFLYIYLYFIYNYIFIFILYFNRYLRYNLQLQIHSLKSLALSRCVCLYELYACIDNTLGTRILVYTINSISFSPLSFLTKFLLLFSSGNLRLNPSSVTLVATIVDTVDSSTISLENRFSLVYRRTRRSKNLSSEGSLSILREVRSTHCSLNSYPTEIEKKKTKNFLLFKNRETRGIQLKKWKIIRLKWFLLAFASLYENEIHKVQAPSNVIKLGLINRVILS